MAIFRAPDLSKLLGQAASSARGFVSSVKPSQVVQSITQGVASGFNPVKMATPIIAPKIAQTVKQAAPIVKQNLSPTNYKTPILGPIRQFNQQTFGTPTYTQAFNAQASPQQKRQGLVELATSFGPGAITKTVNKALPQATANLTNFFSKPRNLVESQTINYIMKNLPKAKADYFARVAKQMGVPHIVSADDAKYIIPGYDGSKAPNYHEASSGFAKMVYEELLKNRKGKANNTVLFTSGGTGSGKTRALKGTGFDPNAYAVVYDTNLSGLDSSARKIQKALDNGYKVEVAYVQRDPVTAFEKGVLPRVRSQNRVVTIDEHINRHSESFSTLQQLKAKYGDQLQVHYVDNTGDLNAGQGARLSNLDELPKFSYNRDELRKVLDEKLQSAVQKGEITAQEANAIRNESVALGRSDVGGRLEQPRTQVLTSTDNFKSPEEFQKSLGENPTTPPLDVTVTAPKKISLWQRFWNRSRNVIESQGPAGKQIGQMLQRTRDFAETTAGRWVAAMPTVRKLSEKEFDNFVDVAEGKAQPLNDKVSQAAQEWDGVRNRVYQLAQRVGLDIGKLENYFPHTFDPDAFKGDRYVKAIKHLVATGQAKNEAEAVKLLHYTEKVLKGKKHGNLEIERYVDLPGYLRTKEALMGYIEQAANRISQTGVMGKDYEKARALIGQVAQEGGDARVVERIFDTAVGNTNYDSDVSKLSGALRGFQSFTKLGLGAITNIGQSTNTASVVGILRTAFAAPNAALNPKARDFALKAGVTLDGVLNDLREGAGFSGKLGKIGAPGFNMVEKFNRTLAAWAGKGYAESLAKKAASGSKSAQNGLRKLGINVDEVIRNNGVLSEKQQIQAARKIVERTQFKVDPQDLPEWTSSPFGKILTQFKSFAYNQSAFVKRELIDEAMRGNVAPIARYLILAPLAGGAIAETKNVLRARPSEEDPNKRGFQYFQQGGGVGIAGDVANAIFPQNSQYLPPQIRASRLVGTLGGPTASDAFEGIAAAYSAAEGKGKPLGRYALNKVPVVGPTLKNMAFPYKEVVAQEDQKLTKKLEKKGADKQTIKEAVEKQKEQRKVKKEISNIKKQVKQGEISKEKAKKQIKKKLKKIKNLTFREVYQRQLKQEGGSLYG